MGSDCLRGTGFPIRGDDSAGWMQSGRGEGPITT